MRSVVLLLPCFNEEQALPPLLERIRLSLPSLPVDCRLSVLVVDDGSTDRTAEVARRDWGELAIEFIQHSRNLGLGAAISTGIGHYLASGPGAAPPYAMAAMDADGTHPPELLPEMLSRLEGSDGRPACDVVIASRYAPGGEEHGLPPLRRIYSRVTSAVFSLLAPIRGVRDYSCGYRLYRAETLARATIHFKDRLVTERGFTCMVELLIKLARTGARISEVPLKLHYELRGGASKMNVAATIRRYVALAWHMLFDPNFR